MRVAFVGQRTYFEACALHAPAAGLEPVFVDHRGGRDAAPMVAAVRAAEPDVVVVFRPEIVPSGAFDGLPALTLGFNTEPLPRSEAAAHPDQVARLTELATTDPTQFDRIITFDPLSAIGAAGVLDVWRSVPLPVDDRFYRDIRPVTGRARVGFIGNSTAHREAWLIDAKHHHDVLHVAHGLTDERLREMFGRIDVAINLHAERYPSFENRVCLHLAAGHLVLSERLEPLHGLEPGVDFVELGSPAGLMTALDRIGRNEDLFRAIRVRGRLKAEQFRASRVWPRLLADLQRDVAAFGGR